MKNCFSFLLPNVYSLQQVCCFTGLHSFSVLRISRNSYCCLDALQKLKGGNSRHAARFIKAIQVKRNPLVQNWINNSSGCSESNKITMKNDLSVREYVQKHQVFMYVNPMHTKGQKLKPELTGQVSFCFETKKCHVTRHWKIHPHLV